jgi:hypothetical protein
MGFILCFDKIHLIGLLFVTWSLLFLSINACVIFLTLPVTPVVKNSSRRCPYKKQSSFKDNYTRGDLAYRGCFAKLVSPGFHINKQLALSKYNKGYLSALAAPVQFTLHYIKLRNFSWPPTEGVLKTYTNPAQTVSGNILNICWLCDLSLLFECNNLHIPPPPAPPTMMNVLQLI